MGMFASGIEQRMGKAASAAPATGSAGARGAGDSTPAAVPDASVLEPEELPERRTRRLHMVLRPSEYDRWSEVAEQHGMSLSALVCRVMDAFCEGV